MPDDPTEALDELWTDYKSNGTSTARERLILHYSPLVKFVAGRVAAGLPQSIEQADLVSYGIFGLIDAIDKFDPGRGFKFETYAISRIKGAIIDELRSIDWVPRSVRAKARAIERAISKLENELRRSPEDAEVAAELEWSESELTQTLSQISFTGLVALDDLLAASSSDRSGAATVSDTITDGKHDPVEAYEVDEMKHLLADAINRMPDRERLVLTLYYYEGLTLAEIGESARRHREPGLPDPHQVDPAAARSAGRARARVRARPLLTDPRHPPGRALTFARDCPLAAARATGRVDAPPPALPRVVSSTDHGVGHAYCTSRAAPARVRRRLSLVVLVVLVGALLAGTAGAAACRARRHAAAWHATGRRSGRAAVRCAELRLRRRAPRASTSRAAPGTPVRAANDGVVSFAGSRRRHAARRPSPTPAICAPRTRSSSSVGVRIGQPVDPGRRGRAHRRRRHRPRRPRAPLRAAHRRPLRRPDAAVPPARPHQARAPGARGRP